MWNVLEKLHGNVGKIKDRLDSGRAAPSAALHACLPSTLRDQIAERDALAFLEFALENRDARDEHSFEVLYEFATANDVTERTDLQSFLVGALAVRGTLLKRNHANLPHNFLLEQLQRMPTFPDALGATIEKGVTDYYEGKVPRDIDHKRTYGALPRSTPLEVVLFDQIDKIPNETLKRNCRAYLKGMMLAESEWRRFDAPALRAQEREKELRTE